MSYKIPLFDLNFNDKEENAILEVLRSRWISTGPKVASFENKFAKMLNVENAIALTNCTMSLHLALMLIGISPDDEVICPSLTFVATVNAIRYMDAIPVFADVTSYENPTIDPKDILEKITPETKAIMVMHYGGFSCDMSRILEIAKNHDLKVIEDACHGPLAEYKGKKLGTIGDIGCFSFFSNKNISTGEGGMLITNNGEYAERARLLKSHGMTSMSYERSKGHSTAYDVVELGYNYRMDDIRAALGLAQLNKLKDDLISRAEIRCMYLDQLNGVDNIIIPFKDYPYFSSNYIFPIILKNSNFSKRNFVREQLAEAGIQTSVHYPAVHSFSIYKDYYIELKITDYLADNLITLPMYSKLNATNVCYIVSTLRKILHNE